MTREELDIYVDAQVTNKTTTNSLTPTNEGNAIKSVADYVDENKEDLSNKIEAITGESIDKYTSEKAVVDYVALSKPYKSYVVLLSQIDTDDPIVETEFENQIGSIVWSRVNPGYYTGTLVGAFPVEKFYLSNRKYCIKATSSFQQNIYIFRATDDMIVLTQTDGNSTGEDELKIYLEIRVYN